MTTEPCFELNEKHFVSTTSTTSLDNNIRTSNHSRFDKGEEGAEQISFGSVFNQRKSKVIKEVAIVLSDKKSMNIKLAVNFEIAYINTDPFQDDITKTE